MATVIGSDGFQSPATVRTGPTTTSSPKTESMPPPHSADKLPKSLFRVTPVAAEKLKSNVNITPVKVTDDLLSKEPRFTFRSQAAVIDDEVEKQGGKPVVMKITSLQMLLATEVMDQLSSTAAKRTLLVDVKVSRSEFDQWIAMNGEKLSVAVEFDGEKGCPVVKADKSTIHSMISNVFYRWFDSIAMQESGNSTQEYRGTTEQRATIPGTNSIHQPDAALIRLPSSRPIVAVEVGISQILPNLFDVAESYLRHGNIDVVIVVDIQERGRARLRAPRPWGLSDSALATLDREQLIEKVIKYHEDNSIAIVGNLSVSVFLWSRERIHPPPHPIWTLDTANGPGTFNSHRMRHPYLIKQGELLLFGQKWAFPFTTLDREVNAAVSCEKWDRIETLITTT